MHVVGKNATHHLVDNHVTLVILRARWLYTAFIQNLLGPSYQTTRVLGCSLIILSPRDHTSECHPARCKFLAQSTENIHVFYVSSGRLNVTETSLARTAPKREWSVSPLQLFRHGKESGGFQKPSCLHEYGDTSIT